MFVSHIITDVENLGPGKRVCVWFCGCSKGCPGCCSPELWGRENAVSVSPERLAEIVNYKLALTGADGITLSGGDPLEQPDIVRLLPLFNTRDVLIFTGYDYSEIEESGLYDKIKDYISAVKCGRYIKEQDKGHPLMGSDNQKIIYSSPLQAERFEAYIIEHGRQIRHYRLNNRVYYTGLPGKEE